MIKKFKELEEYILHKKNILENPIDFNVGDIYIQIYDNLPLRFNIKSCRLDKDKPLIYFQKNEENNIFEVSVYDIEREDIDIFNKVYFEMNDSIEKLKSAYTNLIDIDLIIGNLCNLNNL